MMQRIRAIIFGLLIPSTFSWVFQSPIRTLDATRNLTRQYYETGEGFGVERRQFLNELVLATSTVPLLGVSLPALAQEEDGYVFKRETKGYAYSIVTPSSFSQTQKPVKTHLDEINFVSDSVKGYQYGITVDPVRIDKLKEFGSPEEVAAKVVTAEVNRDGVFEVTLLEDPYESDDGAYVLEYLSTGKRGNKHFITKIFVSNKQLYVLTAQVKEEDYKSQREEVFATVKTFHV